MNRIGPILSANKNAAATQHFLFTGKPKACFQVSRERKNESTQCAAFLFAGPPARDHGRRPLILFFLFITLRPPACRQARPGLVTASQLPLLLSPNDRIHPVKNPLRPCRTPPLRPPPQLGR